MAANDAELWCQNGLMSHGSAPPARRIRSPSCQTARQTCATQDQEDSRVSTPTLVPKSQPFCESSCLPSIKKLAQSSNSSLGLPGVELPKKSFLSAYIEEQTHQLKGRDSPMASSNVPCLGSQETVLDKRVPARQTICRQRISSTLEKQHPAYAQGGSLQRRRSWHRQEQPLRHGSILPVDRPRQRGAIVAPFQGQNHHGPTLSAADTHAAPAVLGCPPSSEFEMHVSGISQSVFEKNTFLEMWLKLEAAIESHERVLINMKMEMDKATSEVKAAKVAALKEKKEVEGSKGGVMENLQFQTRQTDEIKCRRGGLEQISTDLSVQVAELNCLLQQLQEQQRTLEVLKSLENHYKPSENEDNDFMDKNLQQCELKLATIETELARSRETSERLEQAALGKMAELKEITSSLRPKEDLEPPVCHDVDLKRPKLEPVG